MGALNRCLYLALSAKVTGTAKTMIMACPHGQGLEQWRRLARWFAATDGLHSAASLHQLGEVRRCKALSDVPGEVSAWKLKLREHEGRFGQLEEPHKMAMLLGLIPQNDFRNRFAGNLAQYRTAVELERDLLQYARECSFATGGVRPMDIGAVDGPTDPEKSPAVNEELLAAIQFAIHKGQSWKGDKGDSKGGKPGKGANQLVHAIRPRLVGK